MDAPVQSQTATAVIAPAQSHPPPPPPPEARTLPPSSSCPTPVPTTSAPSSASTARSASPAKSRIPTSAASTTSAKRTACPTSPWSTWMGRTWLRCSSASGVCPPTRRWRSPARSARAWPRRTIRAPPIAPGSPPTSCSTGAATWWCWTPAWPPSPTSCAAPKRAAARPPTWHPSSCAANRSRPRATSTRSAWCCTRSSPASALGMVLYEIFTGKRAYEAATMADLIRLQERAQITSMSSIAAEIDPAVEKAIRRCLDPDPAKRPASALMVAAALPGGDPLAAALAAGETPSPDLVAASGETEGLPLKKSVPLALALAALIIAVPLVRTNVELHSLVPFELSPDALAAKVREHAAAFGYTALPADKKYDLHWDWDAIFDARKHVKPADEARRWFQAESPLRLGYRESPLPLISLPDGEITETRPAPIISGMIEAWVNSKGELRFFQAVPPQVDRSSAAREVDVQAISRAIGFDISQWPETTPRFTPLYAFDWQKAWKGQHATLHTDLIVQAAAWHDEIGM